MQKNCSIPGVQSIPIFIYDEPCDCSDMASDSKLLDHQSDWENSVLRNADSAAATGRGMMHLCQTSKRYFELGFSHKGVEFQLK